MMLNDITNSLCNYRMRLIKFLTQSHYVNNHDTYLIIYPRCLADVGDLLCMK